MMVVDSRRVHVYRDGGATDSPVLYWMQRDQRAEDNWALLFAREKAQERNQPLAVMFCLAAQFLGATESHYRFMLSGLAEVAETLKKLNIPFFLVKGNPSELLPRIISLNNIGCLVTDFNPLKPVIEWKETTRNGIQIPFYEVDAHNVLPCREISPKAEFSAMHLRSRINKRLSEFLVDFPALREMPESNFSHPWNWSGIQSVQAASGPSDFNGYEPGPRAATAWMNGFITGRLDGYALLRNDPTQDGQSGLSPYLHFGHIAAQRVALEVSRQEGATVSRQALLEELIVRRELADNFCHYNRQYDSTQGFHRWAKETLNVHRGDPRPFLYTFEQFRDSETHDLLWNAAQRQLVSNGKMHGFMRMYWAKKILEWTNSPEEAMEVAIGLNDAYSLDGRDPNGYAGIAWSIGGVHDRAWGERPVFGKIRYMNFAGCKRKFEVEKYIRQNFGVMMKKLQYQENN